jgi:hypothetical protein
LGLYGASALFAAAGISGEFSADRAREYPAIIKTAA